MPIKKISIVMGSHSDFKTMKFCKKILSKLKINQQDPYQELLNFSSHQIIILYHLKGQSQQFLIVFQSYYFLQYKVQ